MYNINCKDKKFTFPSLGEYVQADPEYEYLAFSLMLKKAPEHVRKNLIDDCWWPAASQMYKTQTEQAEKQETR